MPFKQVPQKFSAAIKEVVIGTGDTALTLGGENLLPLYSFDGSIKNPPQVGLEISDMGPDRQLPGIAGFYAGAESVGDAAGRACTLPGVSFISLVLDSADPNGGNASIEDSVALCKAVAEKVSLPLVIRGSGNVEKDKELLPKIAEALQGKNVMLMSAKEDNYKPIAVAAVQAYGQKIGAESSVDINLAKQLNVLISQIGVSGENMAMNLGSAAAGYGFEYVASTIERVKGAALAQNDTMLQMPIISPVAQEVWSVKESVVSEEDFPDWGPVEQRGINMEISTAVASLAAGSNAVILRHPTSVAVVSKLISDLT
ncbi:MAG: acetyl-CoA decarbonylase/synthase complex subunit delta [Treponema sp.]|jgi:acetyl-CoA decarbonylase/synthase complex subunit delta|nr:acetyl-CoA decarbonylase/synthase complex subunit delta [Treponema sp.]